MEILTNTDRDCHGWFPGHVRLTSANSCRDCGGNLADPTPSSEAAAD